MDELKKSEVEGELLLGDASVGPEPGAEEGPEPFHGVDVDLAKSVAVLVAGIFPSGMTDGLMMITPILQAVVDIILIGMDESALGNGHGDDRLDRLLLDIFQHFQNNLSSALDHAEDGRFFLFQRAASRRSLKAAAAPRATFFATASGLPLCPATT